MNPARFLHVLGADPAAWARRYDIEPLTAPCDACGALLTTTIPIAQGTLRGLRAPTCACGHERTPWCVVRDPKAGDLLSGA